MSAIIIRQLMSWLGTQVMFGRAHTEILRGLLRADPLMKKVAPTFVTMTIDAHAEASMMCLNRIFDKRSDCLTINVLLDLAAAKPGTFKFGTPKQVKELVRRSKAAIATLEPSVKALRVRRNETGSHSAWRPIVDPNGYTEAGRIKHKEIDMLFNVVAEILTDFSQLYVNRTWSLRLPDESDYARVLALLSDQSRTVSDMRKP
jgi:hypothetical protein